MTSIAERLQELLDQKDQEIADLEAEVDEMKNTVKQAMCRMELACGPQG